MSEKKRTNVNSDPVLAIELLDRAEPLKKLVHQTKNTSVSRRKKISDPLLVGTKSEAVQTSERKQTQVQDASTEEVPAEKKSRRTGTKGKVFPYQDAMIHVQFEGKSYTNKDLAKITKNVWVYDMGRKATEIKQMEIYVKPEEKTAYFVINKTVQGKFYI